VWRVFECGRRGCSYLIKFQEDTPDFPNIEVECPTCGFGNTADFIRRGSQWKYCRVCEQLQPIGNFDRHRRFSSGRQLECKSCKKLINAVLNPRRTADQHREAAQHRRLYNLLAGQEGRLESERVFERFRSQCFSCDKALDYSAKGTYAIDHTLPAKYLWPVSTETATLLCDECNNAKHEKWPSEFYSEAQLRKLSFLTGIPYPVLAGRPMVCPDALRRLLSDVDGFLVQWIRYPTDIKRIRTLIREHAGIDIYNRAHNVPDFLLD